MGLQQSPYSNFTSQMSRNARVDEGAAWVAGADAYTVDCFELLGRRAGYISVNTPGIVRLRLKDNQDFTDIQILASGRGFYAHIAEIRKGGTTATGIHIWG